MRLDDRLHGCLLPFFYAGLCFTLRRQVTCDTMIGFSIIAVPTSKDQCNLPGGLLGYVAGLTHAKGMEWLGPKCCSGKKHHELCKGVLQPPPGKALCHAASPCRVASTPPRCFVAVPRAKKGGALCC